MHGVGPPSEPADYVPVQRQDSTEINLAQAPVKIKDSKVIVEVFLLDGPA
jgi:hypothetical protein